MERNERINCLGDMERRYEDYLGLYCWKVPGTSHVEETEGR